MGFKMIRNMICSKSLQQTLVGQMYTEGLIACTRLYVCTENIKELQ